MWQISSCDFYLFISAHDWCVHVYVLVCVHVYVYHVYMYGDRFAARLLLFLGELLFSVLMVSSQCFLLLPSVARETVACHFGLRFFKKV